MQETDTHQLDSTVQLHCVDFEGWGETRSTSFLASVVLESVAGWLEMAIEGQFADCRRRRPDNAAAVQADCRSPHAIGAAEDVKAPVLGTIGADDAA